MRRALLVIFIVAILGLIWSLRSGHVQIPDDWNPWATLDIDATPNWLTRYKLDRLSQDAEQCQAVLSTSGIEYQPIADENTGEACGYFNAIRISQTSAAVGEPFALTCRAAISLALWERHVLQPSAQEMYASPVSRIEHFGSYACRNVYGRPNATRSRHATAEAFDIAGFVLESGERIRVVNHWDDEAHGPFLHTIRDGACRFFDGVLSPDYNAAHRDHFHFDRGSYRICR